MENKKTQIITILLSFIAIFLLLYYVFILLTKDAEFSDEDNFLALQDKHSEQEEISRKEIESFNQTMKDQHERQELVKEKHPDDLTKYESALAERYIELAKTQIHDPKLWGRVIDQHGEPVVDATIKYSGGGYVYATGSPPEVTKTDTNGNFLVVAKGRTLHINKPEQIKGSEYLKQGKRNGLSRVRKKSD